MEWRCPRFWLPFVISSPAKPALAFIYALRSLRFIYASHNFAIMPRGVLLQIAVSLHGIPNTKTCFMLGNNLSLLCQNVRDQTGCDHMPNYHLPHKVVNIIALPWWNFPGSNPSLLDIWGYIYVLHHRQGDIFHTRAKAFELFFVAWGGGATYRLFK